LHAPEVIIHGTTPGERSSIYVFGKVNGKPVHLLVDTGATKTIIRPDALERKGLINQMVTLKLRTATGQEVPTHGKIAVLLEIGSQVINHEVIVADITEEFILGMDVIRKYGFHIDLKNDALRIDNEEIPFSDAEQFIHFQLDFQPIQQWAENPPLRGCYATRLDGKRGDGTTCWEFEEVHCPSHRAMQRWLTRERIACWQSTGENE